MKTIPLDSSPKRNAVIVGGMIGYSSLDTQDKNLIQESLPELFGYLRDTYEVYLRHYKGDYIECYLPQMSDALEVMLLCKTFLKSLPIRSDSRDSKYFKEYAIRQALGVGTLFTINPEKGIIDGEAIYLAGRKINEESNATKNRKIIKKTLFYLSENPSEQQQMSAFFALIDVLLNRASSKQSEIIYMKLKQMEEKEIAAQLEVNISVVNRQSNSVGWNAIHETLHYFRYYFTS